MHLLPALLHVRPNPPCPASNPCLQDAPRDENSNTESEHAGRLVLLKGITGSFRPGVRHSSRMGAPLLGVSSLQCSQSCQNCP